MWFHASPMSTSAGAAFSYVPMQLGMTGCYLPRFDPEVFCDLAEAGAIHTAFLVPAMVERLLGREDLSDRDLSSLEIVSVGSAPVAPSTLLALAERVTNGMVFNGYALTESARASSSSPPPRSPSGRVRRSADATGRGPHRRRRRRRGRHRRGR